MATLIQRYDVAATTKTHGLVDGVFTDLLFPSKALDSTGEMLRMGVFALFGWVGRGYSQTKTFSLMDS